MPEKNILGIITGVCIGLIIASIVTSCTSWNIPGPDTWLVDWTTWVGTVVTIVVAARIFWIGGNTLHKLLTGGLPCREKRKNEPQ